MYKTNKQKLQLINTRPIEQGIILTQQLVKKLGADSEIMGLEVINFPLITISPLEVELRYPLSDYDIIIFISQNAVENFFKQFSVADFSPSCLNAAIGEATANSFLQQTGKRIDIVPLGQSDSEHLLENPKFKNINGNNILIVRGLGGREHLFNELLKRGANVSYCEVYQRQCPKYSQQQLNNLISEDKHNILLIFSSESLYNLLQLTKSCYKEKFLSLKLIVIHQKIKEKAVAMGFCGTIDILSAFNPESLIKYLNKYTY